MWELHPPWVMLHFSNPPAFSSRRDICCVQFPLQHGPYLSDTAVTLNQSISNANVEPVKTTKPTRVKQRIRRGEECMDHRRSDRRSPGFIARYARM